MTSAEILARRREELINIIALQRSSLALQRQAWGAGFENITLAWNLLKRLRKNPLLAGTLVLGIILLKPRAILGTVKQTSAIWQRIRVLLPLVSLLLRASKVK